MLRRHTTERRERIRRQEAVVEHMIADGHTDLLELAEDLLATMRCSQDRDEAELAKAEASAQQAVTSGLGGDPTPGSLHTD